MRRVLGLALALLLAFAGGLLIAQTETPTATPDDSTTADLTCDPAELVLQQLELATLIDDFASDLDEDSDAALAQLYDVGLAYQNLALECGHLPDNLGELYVGTDVDLILRALETINGDPLNGQLIYNNIEPGADGTELGCVGCHSVEEVAPLTEGTWTRWDEIRSEEPLFADYTFDAYMVESIVHPWDYTVPGYPEGTMPNNYGHRMSYQNMADIIAYLFGQDQFIE